MRVEVETPYGKHHIEVRFVIKNPDGTFFTEMKESGTRPIMANGSKVADEILYRPLWEASLPRFASQFDTEADAMIVMDDSRFGGAASFEGCTVVASTA
jgi:hypothetical protein